MYDHTSPRSAPLVTSCGLLGGSPGQSVYDCVLREARSGCCDAFVEEGCDYHGGDTGLSAPEGEITNPLECEQYCQLLQVGQCLIDVM